MKKHYKLVLVFIFLGIFIPVAITLLNKIQEKNTISKQLKILPKFQLMALDGNLYTNTHLKPHRPTIFIFFNTECDYCQHEAKNIADNLDSLKKVQLLFISEEPTEKIQEFSKQHYLNTQPNIIFLHDKASLFASQIDINSVPFILIYDDKNRLIKKHQGQLNTTGILNTLSQ